MRTHFRSLHDTQIHAVHTIFWVMVSPHLTIPSIRRREARLLSPPGPQSSSNLLSCRRHLSILISNPYVSDAV